MKVVVTGGRKFDIRRDIFMSLDPTEVTLLVHGDAEGADTMARQWADFYQIPSKAYPADKYCQKYGDKIGPKIRNSAMLNVEKPDFVLAFPGEDGTHDCMKKAAEAGIRIRTRFSK